MNCRLFLTALSLVFSGAAVSAVSPQKKTKAKLSPLREADLPPLVLMGSGRLDCTISSTANGRQELRLTAGSGVQFDAEVTPILDGILELKNGRLTGKEEPEEEPINGKASVMKGARGMNYRFTSHLARARRFSVTGFTRVTLAHLETRVSVNARRYRQENGPGTAVTFSSDDMDKQGVYIEFRGIFRDTDTGKRFAFRTILGPPTDGQGQVTPLDSNDNSRIIAKTVVVEVQPKPGGPFTQITTTIREMNEE